MIRQFEREHSSIIRLLDTLVIGKNPSVAVGGIVDHVSFHFIAEDRFMREINYPKQKREKHLEEHNHLQESLLALLPKLISGNISEEELDIFREHLMLHISSLDAEMIEYTATYYPERMHETEFAE